MFFFEEKKASTCFVDFVEPALIYWEGNRENYVFIYFCYFFGKKKKKRKEKTCFNKTLVFRELNVFNVIFSSRKEMSTFRLWVCFQLWVIFFFSKTGNFKWKTKKRLWDINLTCLTRIVLLKWANFLKNKKKKKTHDNNLFFKNKYLSK